MSKSRNHDDANSDYAEYTKPSRQRNDWRRKDHPDNQRHKKNGHVLNPYDQYDATDKYYHDVEPE